MALPIPTILENAANVIKAANRAIKEGGHIYDTEYLEVAVSKVNENDLAAVMNEVGSVYLNLKNLHLVAIGTRGNPSTKKLEIMAKLSTGAVVATMMDYEEGQQFVRRLQEDMETIRPNGLIRSIV